MLTGEFNTYFDAAIVSIFAREFLEGAVIIVNYRTLIMNAEHWNNSEQKKQALREVTISAVLASFVAVVMMAIVAIVLGVLSSHLNERVVAIIEGVSQLVAAVAIMQLSVKIPVWLGLYENVSIIPCRKHPSSFANDSLDEPTNNEAAIVSMGEIRFNVSWNIWREVAECGVFLIPVFLGGRVKAVPLSALVGILFASVMGILLYIALNRTASKFWLASVMSLLTVIFSAGLFANAAHKFELVVGETPTLFVIQNPFFSSENFPMLIFEPFGYSTSDTILQVVCFWCWFLLGFLLHYLKHRASQQYKEQRSVRLEERSISKAVRSERTSGTEITLGSENNVRDRTDLEADITE